MSVVSMRYARALMNLAQRDKQVAEVAAGLSEFADLVAESQELSAFLAEPKVPQAGKAAAVAELLDKAELPALLGGFLRFITAKRRIAILEDIRRDFHDLADEQLGRAGALVTVAAELTPEQEQRLRERLQGLSEKQDVHLDVTVDPNLLGGVVARIGSTVWDGSLRNQLNRIQQTLSEG